MQNDKSQLKPIVGLKGFTLLELLIVMSIIVLLMSILLPCLWRAKESAYELCAIQTEVDEEGKVRLEIEEKRGHILNYELFQEQNYWCESSHPTIWSGVLRNHL